MMSKYVPNMINTEGEITDYRLQSPLPSYYLIIFLCATSPTITTISPCHTRAAISTGPKINSWQYDIDWAYQILSLCRKDNITKPGLGS